MLTTEPTPFAPVRVGIMGTGLMAASHINDMIGREDTVIAAVCEPSTAAYEATARRLAGAGVPLPPNEPDWRRFLTVTARDERLDAVMITTPHALHFDQATAALEAGLDVYLEKPMVLDAGQAVELIRTRDRTGRLLVVGFQGSLSPQVRTAAAMLRAGELGAILNIEGVVWQDWQANSAGTWRQDPAISGGGFFFDTGAHMLNTIADLGGEDVSQVAAWLENDGSPVDLRGVVMARLASGALITMNGCGRAIPSLGSDIWVFCEGGTLRTGIWGERLELQRRGALTMRKVGSVRSKTPWEQFLAVRAGVDPNPSPPEVGLRMARLWDAIRESSARGGAVVFPVPRGGGGMTVRVTVWNEFRQERSDAPVTAVYPDGIHAAIAEGLRLAGSDLVVGTATLDEPSNGLPASVLATTDVLTWWGHAAHGDVTDAVVDAVHARVLDGMGLVVLHSGHFSKIFKRLMGTSCDLKWREDGRRERLWVVDPSHPIAEGLGESIVLAEEEMYGEHFDIPAPDELVLVSWFEGGEVFRSGCTWRRGRGRIVYLRPGHETHPTYFDPGMRRLIANSVRWAAGAHGAAPTYGNTEPVEPPR